MRRRTQTVSGRRKNTPNPPTNPPEPKPTAGSHDIHPEDMVYDHDGPSRKQEEQSDSPILHVVTEGAECARDGCDAAHTVDYLYTIDGMSDELQAAVRGAAGRTRDFDPRFTIDEFMAEYVAEHAEIVDYSGGPILTIQFGDDTFGYWTHSDTDKRRRASGQCYGHVDEATRLGI